MINIKWNINRVLILALLSFFSCTEEFIPETITFEDLLVVEATITDEFKFQEIKLSRTFSFEEQVTFESLADLSIIDDTQNIYSFNETEPGKYISSIMFNIEPNKSYTLQITDRNNKSYISSPVKLPNSTSQITDVSYIMNTNFDGEEGIDIVVDSFDPSGEAKFYRYEYEETSKLIPPFWSRYDPVIVSDTPLFRVHWTLREREERICFNTKISNEIIQTSSDELSEARITKFPIKFIEKTDPNIRDRYSILVKQFVQSQEAYSYFNTLNEFSNSESVFSENQPGFIEGNIFSVDNDDKKVIGFFELASVSTKRIFFNFHDVFPNDDRPFYFVRCDGPIMPLLNENLDVTATNSATRSPLLDMLATGEYDVLEIIFPSFAPPEFLDSLVATTPYLLVKKECSDCTVFGSNIKPDFWID